MSATTAPKDDYFIQGEDGSSYAGAHLLIEFWGCPKDILTNRTAIESALKEAALAARATILYGYLHKFNNGGVSGVLVLAESHISIHTWPERGYAAIDVFMCGACNPSDTKPTLYHALNPSKIEYTKVLRGHTRPPAPD